MRVARVEDQRGVRLLEIGEVGLLGPSRLRVREEGQVGAAGEGLRLAVPDSCRGVRASTGKRRRRGDLQIVPRGRNLLVLVGRQAATAERWSWSPFVDDVAGAGLREEQSSEEEDGGLRRRL